MSNKLVWAKWFWSDWAGDAALNLCSLPARGLWMALLCLAAQGEPYGSVTIKGRAPSNDELFRLIAPRGTRRADFDRWLAELERAGVARRDHEGVICSTRMQHDGALHTARARAANKSWNKAENGQDLHEQTNTDLHMQTPSDASIEPSARAEVHPPYPQRGGRASRNAMHDITAEEVAANAESAHQQGAAVVQLPRRAHRH